MRTYELNRKTYKDVKKMDHGQMSAFCVTGFKQTSYILRFVDQLLSLT